MKSIIITEEELFLIGNMSNMGNKVIEWLEENREELIKENMNFFFLDDFLRLYGLVCEMGWEKLLILHSSPKIEEKT